MATTSQSFIAVVILLSLVVRQSSGQAECGASPCRAGYFDKTNGAANWWACGVDCPGGTYWTDGVCNCACLPCTATTSASITCGQSATGSLAAYETVTVEFVMGSTGKVTFTTCQSSFDTQTRLTDSSGNDITSQSTNACDGDDCYDSTVPCGTTAWRETFSYNSLAAGTYTLTLKGYGSSSGSYVIDAICYVGCGGTVSGSVGSGKTVKYQFTNDAATKVTFTDCPSNFDTQLRLFSDVTGTDITSLSDGACGGDDCYDANLPCSVSGFRETFTYSSLSSGLYTVALTPYSSGGNYVISTVCQSVSTSCGRHRKAWNGDSITTAERNLYINGFKTLADRGVIQLLSRAHRTSAEHNTHYFLPWHRAFVYELETAIRGLGGDYTCFGMPYWDWSSEPTRSEYSSGSALVALTSGLGNDPRGSCIADGSVFANGQYDPESGSCLARDVNYADDTYCTFSSPQQLMDIIDGNTAFSAFAPTLEWIPHSYPHICIGGNMATYNSPDDPLFYLHHTFVDYLWALWQDCRDFDGVTVSSGSAAFAGTVSSALSFTPYSTSRTWTVAQTLDISNDDVSYERGPFWTEAQVDAEGNCDYPVNPVWFPTSSRRLIDMELDHEQEQEDKQQRRRLPEEGTHDYASQLYEELLPQYTDHAELVHVWAIRVCEYEQEQEGTLCTEPEYFDDCSDMAVNPETNDIDISLDELLAKQGLEECQKDIRRAFYGWSSQFHSLKALCAGCFDPFCDRSELDEKCKSINHRQQDSAFSRGVRHYHLKPKEEPFAFKPNEPEPQQPYAFYPNPNEPQPVQPYTPMQPYWTYQVPGYVLVLLLVLVAVNAVCCYVNVSKRVNFTPRVNKYRVVKVAESETEYDHDDNNQLIQ